MEVIVNAASDRVVAYHASGKWNVFIPREAAPDFIADLGPYPGQLARVLSSVAFLLESIFLAGTHLGLDAPATAAVIAGKPIRKRPGMQKVIDFVRGETERLRRAFVENEFDLISAENFESVRSKATAFVRRSDAFPRPLPGMTEEGDRRPLTCRHGVMVPWVVGPVDGFIPF